MQNKIQLVLAMLITALACSIAAAETITVRIVCEAGVKVYLDKALKGETTDEGLLLGEVTPGVHKFMFVKEPYLVIQEVELPAGMGRLVFVDLEQRVINVVEDAVTADGTGMGKGLPEEEPALDEGKTAGGNGEGDNDLPDEVPTSEKGMIGVGEGGIVADEPVPDDEDHAVYGLQNLGDRQGGGRRRAVGRFGGSRASEAAVDAALNWLARHQADDGSWSMAGFTARCEGEPCTGAEDVIEMNGIDNCATALAVQCFLGAGHTPTVGRFKPNVARGLTWLMKNQADDGSFAANNYIHGIASAALAEACAMTGRTDIKAAAQKAVDVILARQNPNLGWSYGGPGDRNDTSVTGWQIMALKIAQIAGLETGRSLAMAVELLDRVSPVADDIEGDMSLIQHCAYTYFRDEENPGHRNATMTAIVVAGYLVTGASNRTDEMIRAMAAKVAEKAPSGYADGDPYFWYYGTLGLFQAGGESWRIWNNALRDLLINNQCLGGCADGSWSPTGNQYSKQGGRLLTTAFACLCLEMYYRFEFIPDPEAADGPEEGR